MTPAVLLKEARAQGVNLTVVEGKLRATCPTGAVPPALVEALRSQRDAILALMVDGTVPVQAAAAHPAISNAPVNKPDSAAVQALAERAGVRMQYFALHAHEWDDAEWQRRRDALNRNIDELFAALDKTGQAIEAYGWGITPAGDWYRLGETPVPPVETNPLVGVYRVVGEQLPAAALVWAQKQRLDLIERMDAADSAMGESPNRETVEVFARVCGAILDEWLAAELPLVLNRPEQVARLGEELTSAELVALDLETFGDRPDDGLNPRKGRIRLLSLATSAGAWLVDCAAVDPRPLFPVLQRLTLVGHNLQFDLQFLAQLGFAPGRVVDTMLLSQVLHAGKGKAFNHSLAFVAEREIGVKLPKEYQKADWGDELTPEMLEYAVRDVKTL
jgi:hypothetical protein